MIPRYSRVAAIDDNEEHLKAITWGLSQAGFCPVPFFFEDGDLDSPPPEPIAGIRIVFTDIHMVGGNFAAKIHSGIIIKCLKSIVASGPYALIFWSKYPADVEEIKTFIQTDGPRAGLTTPIAYGVIDKNTVLSAQTPGGFDAEELRELIRQQMEAFPTLATAAQWEMRASEAAAKTTDAVFSLTQQSLPSEARTKEWESLLAFLATEAVGQTTAARNIDAALDSALLPILEDQLSFVGGASATKITDTHPLQVALSGNRPKRPKNISVARLNASYLIDEAGAASPKGEFERGMFIQLPGSYINSGPFIRQFGREKSELLRKEFLCQEATPEQIGILPLHVLELGPECDHVQNKVSTHRYLLALLVPVTMIKLCRRESGGYHNDSVINAGLIAFKNAPKDEFHLLVSTRCYMTLAPGASLGGTCKFRLRRLSIEEVVHRYTSHTRRPGVMKFSA